MSVQTQTRALRRLSTLSDPALMAEISSGDANAFGELYDRYCARALRVAFAVCRDAGHAEAAVQSAFMSAWTSGESYRAQRGSVAAWLLTIVRHRAIDIARVNAHHSARWASEDALDTVPDPGDLVAYVGAKLEQERLLALIERLPDRQREVITLSFYGGLSHSEIAAALDLPSGTVKGRMRLGLHKLRAQCAPD